jgi:hypothetical protein
MNVHPDWLISGGESGPKARTLDAKWIRHIAADCEDLGVAFFHKQWGRYENNPLVAERKLALEEARRTDPYGNGGGLLDGSLRRTFPAPRSSFSVAA